jgi:hypothetical protein
MDEEEEERRRRRRREEEEKEKEKEEKEEGEEEEEKEGEERRRRRKRSIINGENKYFATKETPCLVMCYAILGNVYPVTEDPRGRESLLGTPNFQIPDFLFTNFRKLSTKKKFQIFPK